METVLGPDGEPEPVGNEKQRLAAMEVAATFNKDYDPKALRALEDDKKGLTTEELYTKMIRESKKEQSE